jgi:hypothetical protein
MSKASDGLKDIREGSWAYNYLSEFDLGQPRTAAAELICNDFQREMGGESSFSNVSLHSVKAQNLAAPTKNVFFAKTPRRRKKDTPTGGALQVCKRWREKNAGGTLA